MQMAVHRLNVWLPLDGARKRSRALSIERSRMENSLKQPRDCPRGMRPRFGTSVFLSSLIRRGVLIPKRFPEREKRPPFRNREFLFATRFENLCHRPFSRPRDPPRHGIVSQREIRGSRCIYRSRITQLVDNYEFDDRVIVFFLFLVF